MMAIAATFGSYAGWDGRETARSPRDVEFYPDETARFQWAESLDTVGDHPVEIVYLAGDRSTDLPVVPGLPRFPRKGEVFLSPRLAKELGANLGAETRYGIYCGEISSSGLMSPFELFAYVGAGTKIDAQGAIAASGYGEDRFRLLGDAINQKPIGTLVAVELVLLILPSVWLLLAAVRVGAPQRRRRRRVLLQLGATNRDIARIDWGESRIAWMMGVAASAIALGAACLTDIRIPGVEAVLLARDVRGYLPVMVLAWAGAAGFCAWLCRTSWGTAGESSNRSPREVAVRKSALRSAAVILVAIASVVLQNVLIAQGAVDLIPVVVIGGILLTVILLPMAALQWLRVGALSARRNAHEHGNPGVLVGAAQVAARPRPAARFGATAAILIVILSVMSQVITLMSKEGVQSRVMQRALGDTVVLITPHPNLSEAQRAPAIDALMRNYRVAAYRADSSGTSLTVPSEREKAELESLGVSSPVASWLAFLGVGIQGARVGSLDDPEAQLLVTAKDGGAIDVDAIRGIIGKTTIPMWTVEVPGDGWIVGAAVEARQCAWLTSLGAIGIILCLMALWTNYSAELLRATRGLSVIQLLAPNAQFARQTLAVRILAPLAIVAAGGCVLALLLCLPPDPGSGIDLPLRFVVTCLMGAIATGVVAWLVTVRECTRKAGSFSLGIDDE